MSSLIKTRETAVWVVLMVISSITWLLGSHHGLVGDDTRYDVVILLALAFFKVRLVIHYFMEVRHAPLELKLSCEAWVLASFFIFTGFNIGLIG